MIDRYEKIRQALAMGPTPGPWCVLDADSEPCITARLPENEGRQWDDPIICHLYEDVTPFDSVTPGPWLKAMPNAQANAFFIAACDPDTNRELLAERDGLTAENARLREALKEAEDAMRFVYTSCATLPQEPQHIQNAAWRRIVNAITKARAALNRANTGDQK